MIKFFKAVVCFLLFSSISAQIFSLRPAPPPPSTNTTTVPITYSFNLWTEYTRCDRICGGGTATRSRQCLSSLGRPATRSRCMQQRNNFDIFQNLRNAFSGEDFTTQVESTSCNTQPCAVTEWEPWGVCSVPCGGGLQSSSRQCLDSVVQSECNFESSRTRNCGDRECFRMGLWSDFGECNQVCNGGIMIRTRQCEVILDPNDPEYGIVATFLQQMSSFQGFNLNIFGFSGTSPSQRSFMQSFRRSCRESREERRVCNNQACPPCPGNQIYHTCRPCQRVCEPVTRRRNNFFQSFTFSFTFLFRPPPSTGCNGVCEAGCGCPTSAPLLGGDGSCYQSANRCPINRFQNTGGRNFQSTIPVNRVTDVPITTTATTTTTTTTTTPAPTPEVLPRNTDSSIDVSQVEICTYGIIIATAPGVQLSCACFGRLEEVPCSRTPTTSCPVICRDSDNS